MWLIIYTLGAYKCIQGTAQTKKFQETTGTLARVRLASNVQASIVFRFCKLETQCCIHTFIRMRCFNRQLPDFEVCYILCVHKPKTYT